ncbi:MAG: signal transduction histidine kinase [Gammaproteobacteria bacterium]
MSLSGGCFVIYRYGIGQISLYRQQQDFVSAVSHELKTPLTSMRMYSEILKNGWASEEKKLSYYAFIHDESERLSRLIANVLQLLRMSRDNLSIEMKSVTVGELLDVTRSKIDSQLDGAGFTLNLQVDPDVRDDVVMVDIDAYTQIMINFIDNAIKFSSSDTIQKIDLRCSRLQDRSTCFTVRDYGKGIQKDQMRKIFELFYRSENEMTRETVGTGIGLALVNQLATAMNGSVDVRNCDPGAEFSLTFPPA